MLNTVIPIKDPANAKERLAPILSRTQREQFAVTLFEQTLSFLQRFRRHSHILVVTDSDVMEKIAGTFSVDILREEKAAGETEAVEKASAWSTAKGFTSQLVMPGDMADLDPDEFQTLLRHPRPEPSVLLCPATGDDGTNAILTMPPTIIPFRFGDRSFPDYRKCTRESGVSCEVIRLQSLVLDLDTPDDVRTFMNKSSDTPAKALLSQWKIHEKS